ncbi:MAG TPA: cytochrome b/b6 domain-containing protein [Candidatus Aquicultor sp.]|jgi:Ni/Fe-hydrogenase 1 B-type cytochrome subunit
MLAVVNVWVDIIAIVMVVVGIGFWSFQIIGNFVTGRFRRKFIGKEWPHHDHIIPKSPKLLHVTHVISMIALGISGVYTRFPFFDGGRDTMKIIHFVFMYIVVINFVLRIYYAYIKDSVEFKITLRDIKNGLNVMLYYMFVKRSYPHLTKYNVLQKGTYGYAFPSLMIIQAFTGFSLMWPSTLLGWAGGFVGGVAAAAAWARVIHFFCAMAFLMFTMIHVCLSFVEDYPALLIFFGLAKQEVAAGHGHEHEPQPLQPDPSEA